MTEVIEYWRAIELFDPPNIPRATKLRDRTSGTEWVQPVMLDGARSLPTLPWQAGHRLSDERPKGGRYGACWRHTVYGGVFSLDAVREKLTKHFGYPQEEDYGGARKSTESAVFGFTVDEHGLLVEDTLVFSSCAWATGRVRDPGPQTPGWLDGFGDLTEEAAAAVALLAQRRIPYGPGAEASEGWRKPIGEILGSAAEGAVTALIASLSGTLGAIGVGALSGAAKPVLSRLNKRLAGNDSAEHPEDAKPQEQEEESGPGRPLVALDLVAFAAYVADLCGVSDLVDDTQFRIRSQPVSRKRDGSLPDAEPPFLNSLFPEDLERVAGAAAQGYGRALTAYLTAPDAVRAEDRVDVRENSSTVLDGVGPGKFPLGRWPADTDKPLVLSQQFAVNTISAELMHGDGLFSVNGPPGTGKSTLLRDLIAAIVVERATALARLPSPANAFTGTSTWTVDGTKRSVRVLRPELTGHEIVVASFNNGAVENITTELPARRAIGDDWRSETSYFLDQATALLGGPAWGAIAAPLGKQEKRRQFLERFWWGEGATGMQRLLQNLEDDPVLHDPPVEERFPSDRGCPAPVPSETPPTPTGWHAAVDRFHTALREATRLRDERLAAEQALRHRTSAAAETAAVINMSSADVEWMEIRERSDRMITAARATELTVQALRIELEQHRAARPRGLGSLIGVGETSRQWREREKLLEQRLSGAYAEHADAQGRAHAAAEQERIAREKAGYAAEAAERIRTERAAEDHRLKRAREAWGSHFPEDWQERDDEERELSAPWSDEEWVQARTRLFLAALDLNRAFITGAAGIVRRNLVQLTKTLGRASDAPPPDAQLAAWQTLFLLIPVVSTTFSSCGRLFGALGRESLGWLLIDEAGQASPQAAVGALWRARRAVLVGDPLQLEPVIQLPMAVQELLRQCYRVEPEWLPSRVSAQGVADRVNRWGTSVVRHSKDGEPERVWVGAPLRVHRRCEQPMFEICNAITYDGLMVFGTANEPFPDRQRRPYSSSSWVDVRSADTEGKWVPAEGLALSQMLERLHRKHGVSLDRIRVLSPFRDVVARCKDLVKELDWKSAPLPGVKDYGEQVSRFVKEHIGTIHTMQGKESDVVILVLGTHPRRGQKAREWASETSNLLNVAISRAKRRLYVVGNHAEWSKNRYFDKLAAELPRYSWPPDNGIL
ncbi:AAA domain-containing protein [Actinoallomurus sp. NBC_01490]|uniref:DEAD/DEAH box helicase n=1 Tax=Actinoallomurus sp. NBC_01490 TaxID=2903557 RepID=UPI002E36933F|nr:AAA domain-containing protein [Actinoallomurus sp. NBC_01490]